MTRYMRGMSNGGAVHGSMQMPITDDQLASYVPSVLATEAHTSRSTRFSPVPTIKMVEALRGEDFLPVFAQQIRTRDETRKGYCKHMIRFAHRSRTDDQDVAYQVILINGNDGSSSYQLLAGAFRWVCANGLMGGETYDSHKVRHTGDAIPKVIEGAYSVLEDGGRMMGQIEDWRGIRLERQQQEIFAEAAMQLRYDDPTKAPIEASRLLQARRGDDAGDDLWRTMNRVQENTTRGGQRGRVQSANGVWRRSTVREVGSIDGNTKLQRALWTLTERMAELAA